MRFADLDERMAVYRRRVTPIKKGLLIHESLTNERLAVIKTLQRLHKPKETSPFLSFYTSMGRIYIRLPGVPKAVELFVGATEKDILDICRKKSQPAAVSAPRASAQKNPTGPSTGNLPRTQQMPPKRDHSVTKGSVTSQPKPKHPQGDSRGNVAMPGTSSAEGGAGARTESLPVGPHSASDPVSGPALPPVSAGSPAPSAVTSGSLVPDGQASADAVPVGPTPADTVSATPLDAGPASAAVVSDGDTGLDA